MRVALALYDIREGNYIPEYSILRELFLHSHFGRLAMPLFGVEELPSFVRTTDRVEKILCIFHTAHAERFMGITLVAVRQ